MTVQAELRFLHSPDADPIESYRPNAAFGLFVQAIVGPKGAPGEESFGFTVCSPEWFVSEHLSEKSSIATGRHFIFVREFDYRALEKFVRDHCAACDGKTWSETAEKVGRLGMWEFEDYRETPNRPNS
jgi:hypothetical protein